MQAFFRAASPLLTVSGIVLASQVLTVSPAYAARADMGEATATSTKQAYGAASAVDRDKKTRWEANDKGASLTVMLSHCYKVDDITINWYGTNDYGYTVYISKDAGKTWTKGGKKETGDGNSDNSQLKDKPANAIKIEADKNTRPRIEEVTVNVLRKVDSCTDEYTAQQQQQQQQQSGTTVSSGGSSVTTGPGGTSVTSPGGSVTTGPGGTTVTSPGGTVTTGPAANPNGVPADLVGAEKLAKWKIALPIPPASDMNKAKEVKHPALKTFKDPNYFHLNEKGDGILFTSIAGGARTSKNTAYARSELRQMKGDGTQEADWACTSSNTGMAVTQRLLKTTTNEGPNATVAQIHDAENDVLMVKYFGPDKGANGISDTGRLEVRANNDTKVEVLDPAYKLGDMMTIDITVSGGNMTVKYSNQRSGKHSQSSSIRMSGIKGGCYFKAGLYIQSCSIKDISGKTNEVCQSKGWAAGRYVKDPFESSELELFMLRMANPQ